LVLSSVTATESIVQLLVYANHAEYAVNDMSPFSHVEFKMEEFCTHVGNKMEELCADTARFAGAQQEHQLHQVPSLNFFF
jgi:hypothetical protein